MADLKLGSQIGGNLIWHQGVLELNPLDDSLFYKEFDLISSKGGQTINGGMSLKGNIDTTGQMIGVGVDTTWAGGSANAAFQQQIDNTNGAHWLLASRRKNGSARAGIQVLTNDKANFRIFTNNLANFTDFVDGQVSIQATTPSAVSHATRKDYVDREVDKAMQFAETTTDKLTADLTTANTRINTLDAQNVKITGNQTIAGTKTFTDLPVIQDQPTADTHGANKKYVDTKVGTAVQGIAVTAPLTTTGGVNPTLNINAVTRSASGVMTSTDKIKLDDLPADALSRSGGNMKNNGFIKIEGVGGISSLYNSKEYSIFRDHNNGNVTVGAASGDLYLGYNTDSEVYTTRNVLLHQIMRWKGSTGNILVDSDGLIPWASIKDKVGLEGKTKTLKGTINFDEYDSIGFYNLYAIRPSATPSTNPPPFDYGTMLVLGSEKDANSFVTQIATNKSDGSVYVRVRNDSNFLWNSAGWVKQIDERGGTLKDLSVTNQVQMKNGFDSDLNGVIHKTFESLGNTGDMKPILILLAKRGSTTAIERNGFMGRIHFNRGGSTSNLQGDYVDLVAYSGYTEQFYRLNYISGAKMAGSKLVYYTHTDGIEYIAFYRSANSASNVVIDGLYWNITPVLIADATGKTMTDLVTRQSFYTDYNKPTNDDLDLVSRAGDEMTGILRSAKVKNAIMVNDKGSISFQDGAGTRFHFYTDGNLLKLTHGNEGQNSIFSFNAAGGFSALGAINATQFTCNGDYGFVRNSNTNQGMFVGGDGRTIIGGGVGAVIVRPQGIGTVAGATTFNNDGTITASAQGTASNHLVTKAQIDAVDAKNVAKAGDTMTGALTNSAIITSNAAITVDSNGKKLSLEISNETDKLPYISVDYAYRALEFNANKTITAPFGFEINGRQSNSNYYVRSAGFAGGWARGMSAVTGTNAMDKQSAGIGFLGSNDTVTQVYLGMGLTPWAADGGIQINAANQMLLKSGQSGAAVFDDGASAMFRNGTANAWYHINNNAANDGIMISQGSTAGVDAIAKFKTSGIDLNKTTYVNNAGFQIKMNGGNAPLEWHVPGKHARMLWLDANTADFNFCISNGAFAEVNRVLQFRGGGDGISLWGNMWAGSRSHAYADQWVQPAPFNVDFGAVAGASDYYQILKGRAVTAGAGYTTDVELGMLRTGNVWGQGVIRVGSAESGTKGIQSAYTFDINGNFNAPNQVMEAGNRVYSPRNPPPGGSHTHLNVREHSASTIFSGDINAGNFVLTQPWTNYDMIMFVTAWDDYGLFSHKTFTNYDLQYMQATGWNYDISGGTGSLGWGGRFAADNRTFVTTWENGRIMRVIGYNLKTVN